MLLPAAENKSKLLWHIIFIAQHFGRSFLLPATVCSRWHDGYARLQRAWAALSICISMPSTVEKAMERETVSEREGAECNLSLLLLPYLLPRRESNNLLNGSGVFTQFRCQRWLLLPTWDEIIIVAASANGRRFRLFSLFSLSFLLAFALAFAFASAFVFASHICALQVLLCNFNFRTSTQTLKAGLAGMGAWSQD